MATTDMRHSTSENISPSPTAAILGEGEPTLTERATSLLKRSILTGVLKPGVELGLEQASEMDEQLADVQPLRLRAIRLG